MTGFKTIKARQVDEFSSQDETAITLTKFSCNCEHQENQKIKIFYDRFTKGKKT